MLKRFLLISLTFLLLFGAVIAVSAADAEDEPFSFAEEDARNMFAGQVITIPSIAETAPKVDGVVNADEYTVNVEIANYMDSNMKAKLGLSYKDGFLYVAVQREAEALYKIQVDVGSASTPHPYSTVDRINNRISEEGKIQNQKGVLIRSDDGKWNNFTHPTGGGVIFLDQAAAAHEDGVNIYEMRINLRAVYCWFAEHDAYKDYNTEMRSRCLAFQVWLEDIKNQYCVRSIPSDMKEIWPENSITWGWAMHTIVLPEAPCLDMVNELREGTFTFPELPTAEPVTTEPVTTEPVTTEPATTEPITTVTEATAEETESDTYSETTAPATEATDDTADSDKGCSGSMTSVFGVLAILSAGAAFAKRRRSGK